MRSVGDGMPPGSTVRARSSLVRAQGFRVWGSGHYGSSQGFNMQRMAYSAFRDLDNPLDPEFHRQHMELWKVMGFQCCAYHPSERSEPSMRSSNIMTQIGFPRFCMFCPRGHWNTMLFRFFRCSRTQTLRFSLKRIPQILAFPRFFTRDIEQTTGLHMFHVATSPAEPRDFLRKSLANCKSMCLFHCLANNCGNDWPHPSWKSIDQAKLFLA